MAIVSSGQLTLTDLNDTKQIIVYLNANYKTQIYDPTGATYSPSFTSTNLVITPELYVAGGNGTNLLPSADVQSVTWYEGSQTTTAMTETATGTSTAGYSYAIPTGAVASTAKPLTIKSNLTANQKYTCVIVYRDPDTLFDITVKADVEVARIQNGAKGNTGSTGTNAVTTFLTNSSVTLQANSAGTVSSFSNSGTDIFVYDGTTALTYVASAPANGQFMVTATPTGVTIGAISAGTGKATVANATAMGSDSGSVSYAISGKTSAGTTITATLVQSFAKSKAGVDGTTPSSYWLTTGSDVISKNPVSGAFSPTSVTATSNVQVGSGTPSRATSMKWLIGTSTDGSTFADGSVLTGATATTSAFGATLKAVRFRMYLSTTATPDATNFVDEQVIFVIQDGMDSYYLNVWTPNGDTIRNGGGNLVAQADLYKGAGTVTPTAFKWYVQDPTATTVSGGDADGLAGWRLILAVANATTAPTLALQANANSKLTAQTYFVKYTWVGLSGETIGSTEASLAVTAGNDLKVTIPAFVTNAVKAKVYIGTATGANKYHGEITTSAGNIIIPFYDATATAIPTATTTDATAIASASLTIVAQAIAGVEGYKCVATAPTTLIKYSGLTVVKDFQDPVSVNILGANILKNGQGSVVLTAQLIQNGAEISTAGYTFAWALYNQNGSLNKTLAGTTDTITVNASDFNGVNNLVCDVSK